MKDFIEELKWRGMLHDVIPGTEENLEKIHLMGMEWWSDYGEQALNFLDL